MTSHVEFFTALLCTALLVGSPLACKTKKESSSPVPPASTVPPVAPETTPAVITTDPLHKLGETAQGGDYKLTVVTVKECNVKYYFKPKKGNIKLGAEVIIEGTADRQVPVNPFYAKLTDAEGYTYASTFAGCEPDLKSRQVGKGEQSRGWVSFEIPEKSTGLKLSYAPFVIGRGKQEIKFDLGR
jgi:hypothetical protein